MKALEIQLDPLASDIPLIITIEANGPSVECIITEADYSHGSDTPYLEIEVQEVTFPCEGGISSLVFVKSNRRWEINQSEESKEWLQIDYTGNKEEYILFSTDPNESIKREVRLDFMIEGQIYDFITVVQKGFREPFTNDFKLVSGGTFNVIK